MAKNYSAKNTRNSVEFTICEIHYDPTSTQQPSGVFSSTNEWEYFKVHYKVIEGGGGGDDCTPNSRCSNPQYGNTCSGCSCPSPGEQDYNSSLWCDCDGTFILGHTGCNAPGFGTGTGGSGTSEGMCVPAYWFCEYDELLASRYTSNNIGTYNPKGIGGGRGRSVDCCSNEGTCGAGYECDPSTCQCVRLGHAFKEYDTYNLGGTVRQKGIHPSRTTADVGGVTIEISHFGCTQYGPDNELPRVVTQLGADLGNAFWFSQYTGDGDDYGSIDQAPLNSFSLTGEGYLTFIKADVFFNDDKLDQFINGEFPGPYGDETGIMQTYANNGLVPGVNLLPFGDFFLPDCTTPSDDCSQCYFGDGGYDAYPTAEIRITDGLGGSQLATPVAYSNGHTQNVDGESCDIWPNIQQYSFNMDGNYTCGGATSQIGEDDGNGFKHNLGSAIMLLDLNLDPSDGNNWVASQGNGNPGIANSINYQDKVVFTQFLGANDANSFVAITNVSCENIDIYNWRITGGGPGHIITNDINGNSILQPGKCHYFFKNPPELHDSPAVFQQISNMGNTHSQFTTGIISDTGIQIKLKDHHDEIVDMIDTSYLNYCGATPYDPVTPNYSVILSSNWNIGEDNMGDVFNDWHQSYNMYGDFFDGCVSDWDFSC